jgi:hypothetical protein
MNIYHPYGQPGFLEFQKGIVKNSFGNIDINNMFTLSSMIKTLMIDKCCDDEEYIKACDFLYNADKVFFLGLAYHPQNIDLLFPNKITKSSIKIQEDKAYISHPNYYGTFHNISQTNQNTIISMIKRKNERMTKFHVCNNKCVDFFNEYSSVISFC